jgi:hypothetical protein
VLFYAGASLLSVFMVVIFVPHIQDMYHDFDDNLTLYDDLDHHDDHLNTSTSSRKGGSRRHSRQSRASQHSRGSRNSGRYQWKTQDDMIDQIHHSKEDDGEEEEEEEEEGYNGDLNHDNGGGGGGVGSVEKGSQINNESSSQQQQQQQKWSSSGAQRNLLVTNASCDKDEHERYSPAARLASQDSLLPSADREVSKEVSRQQSKSLSIHDSQSGDVSLRPTNSESSSLHPGVRFLQHSNSVSIIDGSEGAEIDVTVGWGNFTHLVIIFRSPKLILLFLGKKGNTYTHTLFLFCFFCCVNYACFEYMYCFACGYFINIYIYVCMYVFMERWRCAHWRWHGHQLL